MVTNYFAVDQIKVDTRSTRASTSRSQITKKKCILNLKKTVYDR